MRVLLFPFLVLPQVGYHSLGVSWTWIVVWISNWVTAIAKRKMCVVCCMGWMYACIRPENENQREILLYTYDIRTFYLDVEYVDFGACQSRDTSCNR